MENTGICNSSLLSAAPALVLERDLILAAAVGSQVLMFTYVYLPSEQKAMLLVHELIFILWLILEKKKASGGERRDGLEKKRKPAGSRGLSGSAGGSLSAVGGRTPGSYGVGLEGALFPREKMRRLILKKKFRRKRFW